MKYCKKCERTLPLSEFYKDKRTNDGLGRLCKDCRNSEVSETKKKCLRKNPEPAYDYQRNYDLKRNYGITLADYERMFEAQHGVCAICGKSEWSLANTGNRIRKLAVDHETGENGILIRGLLCAQCNVGIGNLKHSIFLLEKAIEYLARTAANDD